MVKEIVQWYKFNYLNVLQGTVRFSSLPCQTQPGLLRFSNQPQIFNPPISSKPPTWGVCKIFNIKKCGYTCPGNLLHALVILGHFFTVKDFQATHLKPSKATNRLRFSLCDFPLHLPLELLGVDLTLQVDNPCDGETLKHEIDAAGTVCNICNISSL